MELRKLLEAIKPIYCHGDLSALVKFKHVTIDSRKVKQGSIFIALPSVWPGKPGGEQFIPQAIKAGAKVIVTELSAPNDVPDHVLWAQVPSPHQAVAYIANSFYPDQPKKIVAVTGTNGKTSVADFTFQLWDAQGLSCGKMGTVTVQDNKGHTYSGFKGFTTPDALTLHENLDAMAKNGIEYLAMEAASHALEQHRMDKVHVDVAAFTNLTHEHLDYHHNMEAYFKAKAKLFENILENTGVAVLNRDVPEYEGLCDVLNKRAARRIVYGTHNADIKYAIVDRTSNGQVVDIYAFGLHKMATIPLIGHFQIENVMCALGCAVATGISLDKALTDLSFLRSVPGRLQQVSSQIYVDYAHSPGALSTVLKALRPHVKGKLHVVFGCGGNRDVSKRPIMGQIAGELADIVYITDDNPRYEDAQAIRKDIQRSCPQAREYADRAQAIEIAIQALKPEDMLLIAGKGHETGQIIGDEVIPFNDVEVARKVLGIEKSRDYVEHTAS